MTRVGIFVNLTKDVDLKITAPVVKWLEERNCEVLLTEITAMELNRVELGHCPVDLYKKSDFILVLGGDGTLIGIAREISWLKTPIVGINLGHLGFITEAEQDGIYYVLEKVLAGEYTIQERMMLEARVVQDGMQTDIFYALNDIGITRGTLSRIISLDTYIDDRYMDTYRADGLLLSTPTGSTAYSLSAGGPIINPEVSVILITPICPHSLNSRSIVISDREIIRVDILKNNQEVYLTADGQQGFKLLGGDSVIIKKAPFTARLIKVSERSFYDVLRSKLKGRNM